MSSESNYFLSYFARLRQIAKQQKYRYGIALAGDAQWNTEVCEAWIAEVRNCGIFQLGGTPLSGTTYVPFKKGQQFLGQECELLICDFSQGWDANSFSAALGTVVGGGIVVVVGFPVCSDNPADVWICRALDELIHLSEQSSPLLPDDSIQNSDIDFSQQQQAITNIVRVVEGHRKRPFILTADRGRGKSSALGMAAAKLMNSRNIDIVVTAPALSSVAPVFQYAKQALSDVVVKRGLVTTDNSSLRFIAPDELLLTRPSCDLLLVDEAAALPLPMLQRVVEHYHRVVFSSTIHGYEGSGRGFTLKFHQWLKSVRSGMHSQTISQPIRWSLDDPLEAWHRKSFLLDFGFEPIHQSIDLSGLGYRTVGKDELVSCPELTHDIFSLLVNAHYQTSPNDLFHLLGDDAMSVMIATYCGDVVGCILSVKEGELEKTTIDDIQSGVRRPKGHLAPVTIANQLGFSVAAQQASVRIMRIAVHPDLQHQGIGVELVRCFMQQQTCDYISTSFGATPILVKFWQRCGFQAIKIGSQRDQSSGCYSLLMVNSDKVSWLSEAIEQFQYHFIYELADSLNLIEADLVKALVSTNSQPSVPSSKSLIRCYAQGGANYESVAVWLHYLLLSLPDDVFQTVSNLMIDKVLLRYCWKVCAQKYSLSGRKQIEAQLRQELTNLLVDLQCKTAG